MTTTAKNHIGRLVVLPTNHNNNDDDNNQLDDIGQVKVYQFDDDTNDEVLLSFANSLANDLNKSTVHDKSSCSWPSVSVLSRRLFNRVSLAKKRYIKRDRKQIVSSME